MENKMKYILSSDIFDDIKSAERRINGWFQSGDLKRPTKLYKVTEVYYPKLVFKKGKL
ncbi:MAG: hypothetical protein BWY48_00493 [Parcubacteria group bacterium ADurb.Bin305]|nr:MAG: hypothetical protein BWY48_00493 [Parcubacteria group bacterium ADurb.Bin305]